MARHRRGSSLVRMVNECKMRMVNGPLFLRRGRLPPLAVLGKPLLRQGTAWGWFMAGAKSRKAVDMGTSSELVRSALRTLETEAAGLAALAAPINTGLAEAFVTAVEKIRAASGRVIVTGMGKSGHIGRKIAATFASTGTPAYFVHPGEASHGDLGMITRDDVIVALSWSGETGELRDLIEYAKRFRVALIAVTSN